MLAQAVRNVGATAIDGAGPGAPRPTVVLDRLDDSALANLPGGLRHLEDAALSEAAFRRIVPEVKTFSFDDHAAAEAEPGFAVLAP
ncbi:hypothetical protein G3I59_09635 [Amycolatopsis rubida]|uniref:Uncharacterized protein n=1 Tax=Amycolatopsis rubida TaxID=112413 RepID=A0ABX0BSK8_9PSEU|nr:MULTISPECIES: hypothetical protein [Amycolatopsis]NEC55841.1 hypothetical protein [Amycolatopsis rubida]OAP26080.1 hypothetical protein A4R44_03457 [Amycolatopsis sp. M39]